MRDNYTSFGVVSVEKRLAICQGFSVTAEYLLKKIGIDIITVTGIASGSTDYRGISRQGHAWNIVKIDGKYY